MNTSWLCVLGSKTCMKILLKRPKSQPSSTFGLNLDGQAREQSWTLFAKSSISIAPLSVSGKLSAKMKVSEQSVNISKLVKLLHSSSFLTMVLRHWDVSSFQKLFIQNRRPRFKFWNWITTSLEATVLLLSLKVLLSILSSDCFHLLTAALQLMVPRLSLRFWSTRDLLWKKWTWVATCSWMRVSRLSSKVWVSLRVSKKLYSLTTSFLWTREKSSPKADPVRTIKKERLIIQWWQPCKDACKRMRNSESTTWITTQLEQKVSFFFLCSKSLFWIGFWRLQTFFRQFCLIFTNDGFDLK